MRAYDTAVERAGSTETSSRSHKGWERIVGWYRRSICSGNLRDAGLLAGTIVFASYVTIVLCRVGG
jgi:hypothetical protein